MKFIKTVFFLFSLFVALLIFIEIKYNVSSHILPKGKFRTQYFLLKNDVKEIIKNYKDHLNGQGSQTLNELPIKAEVPKIKETVSIIGNKSESVPSSEAVKEADKYNSIGFSGYYAKADALASAGQYEESLMFYDKAIAIDPNSEQCLYNRGTVYLNLRRYEQAIADYTLLTDKQTGLIDVYFNRAMAFYYIDKYDEAMNDFNYVITKDKTRYYAYFMRGNIYIAKSMYTAAVSDYTKAAVIKQDDAGIFYNRAVAYEYLGNDNKAIADYSKALELDASHQKAKAGRDRVYQKNGFADKTQKDILMPRNLS